MILEKLKYVVVFLLSFTFVFYTFASDQRVKQITELKALVEYEKKSIKGLLIEANEANKNSQEEAMLKQLIETKMSDLNNKIKGLNELIKAESHSNSKVKSSDVKQIKDLNELKDEIGIDRDITHLYKKVKNVYKDFNKTKEHKEWKEKKETYFKIKERKKKIIFVE